MVNDPDAPQGENQGDWQVDIGQEEAEGNDGPDDDTYVIRGITTLKTNSRMDK
jgi:hypothetical protein